MRTRNEAISSSRLTGRRRVPSTSATQYALTTRSVDPLTLVSRFSLVHNQSEFHTRLSTAWLFIHDSRGRPSMEEIPPESDWQALKNDVAVRFREIRVALYGEN